MLRIIKTLPSVVLDKIHNASAFELQQRGVIKYWMTAYDLKNPEAKKILDNKDK